MAGLGKSSKRPILMTVDRESILLPSPPQTRLTFLALKELAVRVDRATWLTVSFLNSRGRHPDTDLPQSPQKYRPNSRLESVLVSL
jgi:hypothetical protein